MIASALAVLALLVPHGTAPPPPLEPTLVADTFRAVVVTDLDTNGLVVGGPELVAYRPLSTASGGIPVIESGGTRAEVPTGDYTGYVVQQRFAALPDAYSIVDVLPSTAFVLGRARGGKAPLARTTLKGRPALHASYPLGPNACAGIRGGRGELWLDPATLLPLRQVEVRGRQVRRTTVRYQDVGAPIPASAFAIPSLPGETPDQDDGFRRTSPAEAAAHLSYTPLLPASVEPGFALAVTGWAPRSPRNGPEGANPRHRELFAAVYRRGHERIDVTMRLARGAGSFPNDPFGSECGFQFEERATVRGLAARYATGPGLVPHLTWRDGPVLLTVSGPLPKRALVAIAASLAPAS
ncbi:MAG: hypothetical protein R3C15_13605 [Thermoleophilia bacterium]